MKKFIISAIALLTVSSCKDFLTREPVDQISIATQVSTKKGILEALNGAYYNYRSTTFNTAAFTYGDLLSGNLTFSPGLNNGIIQAPTFVDQIYNFNDDRSESELSNLYSDSYSVINNLNIILENLDAVPDASISEKNEIKAETLALRALVHFQLYRVYAQNYTFTTDASHLGIAYVNKTLKVGFDYPARNTAKETFSFLEADINQAISLFQDEQAIPAGKPKNFMSKTAAKTLASIIALWKNDWQTAFDISDDVIKTSGFSLASSADYISSFAAKESIFELAPNSNNASIVDVTYNFNSARDYAKYVLSPDVYSLFEIDDKRKNLYEIKSLRTKENNLNVNKDYYFTTKYKTGTNGLVFRFSELYFIRAEAALKLNKPADALADVNKIRNRAGLSNLSSITLDELLFEKRKEFPMENKYFFDLMRNHKNIVRNAGCISSVCNLNYPNNKFVAPIPQDYIEINSNIKQNEGY